MSVEIEAQDPLMLFSREEHDALPLLVRYGAVDHSATTSFEGKTKLKGEGTITRPEGGYDND